MIQRHVFIAGQVQGVGFRASLIQQTTQYSGVRGFVRNLRDGRVEAVLQGPQKAILELVAWCSKGPSQARVSHLQVIEEPLNEALPSFKAQETV